MFQILAAVCIAAFFQADDFFAHPSGVGDAAVEGGLVAVPKAPAAGTNAVASAQRFATYRRACVEGWAPRPTNDVQRAIWRSVAAERVKGPANPIRILPGDRPGRRFVRPERREAAP